MKSTTPKLAQQAPSHKADPAGLEIICEEFKSVEKGKLRGFAVLSLPAVGLKLIDCGFFDGTKGPFVGFPSRSFAKNGKTQYVRLVNALDHEAYGAFQRAAVSAIQKFLVDGAHAATPLF